MRKLKKIMIENSGDAKIPYSNRPIHTTPDNIVNVLKSHPAIQELRKFKEQRDKVFYETLDRMPFLPIFVKIEEDIEGDEPRKDPYMFYNHDESSFYLLIKREIYIASIGRRHEWVMTDEQRKTWAKARQCLRYILLPDSPTFIGFDKLRLAVEREMQFQPLEVFDELIPKTLGIVPHDFRFTFREHPLEYHQLQALSNLEKFYEDERHKDILISAEKEIHRLSSEANKRIKARMTSV